MDKIYLNDVRIYAYHGCLSEEAIIGSDYRVDMWVEANLNMAKKNDSLKDTVDYVFLLSCIKKEMNVRSKLLEVVAERIINSVFSGSSIVKTVCVKISKINHPIVSLHKHRSEATVESFKYNIFVFCFILR